MFEINFVAVIAATVAAFMMGAVWNSVLFGNMIMKLQDPSWDASEDTRPPMWKLFIEFVRCFIVAFVLAYFVVQFDVAGWVGAVQLGALVWIGFPAMILLGAVLWENEPWKLAAIHVGDWLVKLLLVAVILGVWR